MKDVGWDNGGKGWDINMIQVLKSAHLGLWSVMSQSRWRQDKQRIAWALGLLQKGSLLGISHGTSYVN